MPIQLSTSLATQAIERRLLFYFGTNRFKSFALNQAIRKRNFCEEGVSEKNLEIFGDSLLVGSFHRLNVSISDFWGVFSMFR